MLSSEVTGAESPRVKLLFMDQIATAVCNGYGSHCQQSSPNIAETVVIEIIEAMGAYRGCVLDVGCYTPPYNEDYYSTGVSHAYLP